MLEARALFLAAVLASGAADNIDSLFQSYSDKLTSFFVALRATIERVEPRVLSVLEPPPGEPLAYGYQLLPKLIDRQIGESQQTPSEPPRSYSWPITRKFIESELERIEAAQVKLASTGPELTQLAQEYRILSGNQRQIASLVQYNHFWQKAIEEDRARFDRQTILFNAAVALRTAVDPTQALALRRAIQEGQPKPAVPAFVEVLRPAPGRTEIRVPIYTDIADAGFLETFKTAVERVWRIEDGRETFEVHVVLHRLSTADLYGNDTGPKRGEHIDLDAHVKRFPTDGGVLTTGANPTHAFTGRSILLGVQEMSFNEIAHEFGHVLGFVDSYFRGYRDLGEEGFEVFEIVPDTADIMCSPGAGRVASTHFSAITSK